MVVRSGDEVIVRYGWLLIIALYGGAFAFILVALCFEMLGFTQAAAESSWGLKIVDLAGCTAFAVPTASLAPKLYAMARTFSRGFVSISPEGVRLALLKRSGTQWTRLRERSFRLEEIGNVSYDSGRRMCRFRAGNFTYMLTADNAPSPKKIAKLIVEMKSRTLP